MGNHLHCLGKCVTTVLIFLVIQSLFVVIFYKGSLTEGIFRRSVQMSHLQALVQRVDTNEDPLMAGECSPLHAANILKVGQ